MPERHLLDILKHAEHWSRYTRHFGPPSGSDPKLAHAVQYARFPLPRHWGGGRAAIAGCGREATAKEYTDWAVEERAVPLAVELGTFDVDGGHLGVRYDNAAGVLAGVEFAAHSEAGFGSSGRDQLDDYAIAYEWLGAPVLADEGKEAVLASRAGESHPRALLEPYVNLSIHTAPDVRLLTYRKRQ